MAKKAKNRVMALKSVRHQDGDVNRRGNVARVGSYASPGTEGAIFYVTDERLALLEEQNAVRLLEPRDDAPADEAGPTEDDAPQAGLPLDFPYRRELVAHGLTTPDLVREYPDLTEVKGIGEAYAQRILDALDALEHGEGDEEDDG